MVSQQIDPHNYPGPLEELEKESKLKGQQPKQNRTLLIVIIAIVLLVLGAGIAVYFAFQEGSIDGDIIEDPESFFPFIPIWIAIFIPLIAAKKNKKGVKIPNEKRVLIVLLALGAASAIAFTIFLVALQS